MRVLGKATVSSQSPAGCPLLVFPGTLAKPGRREAESVGELRELVVPAACLLNLPPLNIGSFRHSKVGQSSILHLGAAARWIWIAIRIECCLSISDRHFKISPRVPCTTHCHATNSKAMENRSNGTCGSSSHPTRGSKPKARGFSNPRKDPERHGTYMLDSCCNDFWTSFFILL